MPMISLTQEAIDRGKYPEIGWSNAELHEIREAKAASGTSINYFFEFVLLSGPENKEDNKGRYQTFLVNSAGLKNGNKNAVTMFKNMVAALNGSRPDEIGADDYNTDHLKGKTCWIKIEVQTQEGKLIYSVTDFSADAEIPF